MAIPDRLDQPRPTPTPTAGQTTTGETTTGETTGSEKQSSWRSVTTWAQASAATLGSSSLVGAAVDSASDILPYADPQQWIVAGLVLLGIGAGQKIPSWLGR